MLLYFDGARLEADMQCFSFVFQGKPNFNNKVEADNCWVMAPHVSSKANEVKSLLRPNTYSLSLLFSAMG